MVDAYDYMRGYIKGKFYAVLEALDDSLNEVEAWPLNVYNINDQLLGSATNKQQYIDLWNSDTVNQGYGVLGGWFGPFLFLLEYDYNNIAPDYLGIGGYTSIFSGPTTGLLTEAAAFIIAEDGSFIIQE